MSRPSLVTLLLVALACGGAQLAPEDRANAEGESDPDRSAPVSERRTETEPSFDPGAVTLAREAPDDAELRADQQRYFDRRAAEGESLRIDLSRRLRFRVVDANGEPLNDVALRVQVRDSTFDGRTHPDGVWDFFPSFHRAFGPGSLSVSARGSIRGRFELPIPDRGDAEDVVQLTLRDVSAEAPLGLDLAFLVELSPHTQGELAAAGRTIAAIAARLASERPHTRLRAAVVFAHAGDDGSTPRHVPFTTDVAALSRAMEAATTNDGMRAESDLNAGLRHALEGLSWTGGDAARTLVVLAGSPPRPGPGRFDHRVAMARAAAHGIRIVPVIPSDANAEAELLFRAMAAMTSSPALPLRDGEAGEAAGPDAAPEPLDDRLARILLRDLRDPGAD